MLTLLEVVFAMRHALAAEPYGQSVQQCSVKYLTRKKQLTSLVVYVLRIALPPPTCTAGRTTAFLPEHLSASFQRVVLVFVAQLAGFLS